jgi:hypothetical protein
MLLLGDSPLISSTSTTRAIFSLVLVALAVMVTPRQPAGVKTEAVYLIWMVMVFDGLSYGLLRVGESRPSGKLSVEFQTSSFVASNHSGFHCCKQSGLTNIR